MDKNGSICMCDRLNKRVRRWYKNNNNNQAIIGNISCSELTLDKEGTLYVSDFEESNVIKNSNSQAIAGGNGRESDLNHFSYSISLFVDRKQSRFVADYYDKWLMIINKKVIQIDSVGLFRFLWLNPVPSLF